MSDIFFGVVLRGSDSQASFRELVARADGLGCDVLAAPDHLGTPDPFAVLTAAAQLTDRLRLRTYVLNVGFWNPALLARAAATADVLSAGRLELGLGAGHMRSEYEIAELPWSGHRARVQQLERTVVAVRRHLAEPEHCPRPVQSQVPIAIGAMTAPGLRVAAAHADIVSFAGLLQLPGAPPGTFTIASRADTERRVSEVRQMANGRRYHSDALLQAVVIGQEPEIAAARLAADFEITSERLLDSPFVLLARDRAHAAELIAQRCDASGLTASPPMSPTSTLSASSSPHTADNPSCCSSRRFLVALCELGTPARHAVAFAWKQPRRRRDRSMREEPHSTGRAAADAGLSSCRTGISSATIAEPDSARKATVWRRASP